MYASVYASFKGTEITQSIKNAVRLAAAYFRHKLTLSQCMYLPLGLVTTRSRMICMYFWLRLFFFWEGDVKLIHTTLF